MTRTPRSMKQIPIFIFTSGLYSYESFRPMIILAGALNIFIPLVTLILVVVAVLLVLVCLMQRPKNEGLGAAFGGGVTDQMFGAQTTNVLQKVTVWLGILFFGCTLLLAILQTRQNTADQIDTGVSTEEVENAPSLVEQLNEAEGVSNEPSLTEQLKNAQAQQEPKVEKVEVIETVKEAAPSAVDKAIEDAVTPKN